MKDSKKVEQILAIIPDDYRKNIEGLEIITSSDGTQMLIFTLSRDQRLKFKKLVPLLEDGKSTSFYIRYSSKLYHIGGFTHVLDRVNDYGYDVSPICPMRTPKQSDFYRVIKNSCPKGTTRNAIIINSHCGLFPVHVSKLYNRIYCVDTDAGYSAEAKINLKLNKINNCLLFTSPVDKWLKDFEGYKYTPPGRKHKIGLVLADASKLSKESCTALFNIEPETIILFSDSQESMNKIADIFEAKANHERTFESNTEGFYIRKIKRKEKLEL